METIKELIDRARLGDISSQKFLLEQCQQISLPLTYKYLHQAVSAGMTFDDLRQIVLAAFVDALNSYDFTKQDFYNYFKYLYLVGVKGEIRRMQNLQRKESFIEIVDDVDSNYSLQFQSPLYKENTGYKPEVSKETVYDVVVNRKLVKLTKKEFILFKMFLDGYSIKEMSDELERNYTETCRSLKSGIKKVRIYFENQK